MKQTFIISRVLKISAGVKESRIWSVIGQMCTLSAQMNKGEARISCQVLVLDQVDYRALGLY